MSRDEEPTWQAIDALGTVGALVDAQVNGGRDQYQRLLRAAERPHSLDDAPIERIERVYSDTADDLWLYDTQLARWSDQPLGPAQRREVERLQAQMVILSNLVEEILALAGQLHDHTIEALLANSDLEVGLEWLARHPR